MPEYLLTPPTTDESFRQYDRSIQDPLWRYYHQEVALSIVNIDGVWQVARLASYPGEVGLDLVYRGGSNYVISQARAAELIADGLGEYVEEIV